jgi:hypothetical protein
VKKELRPFHDHVTCDVCGRTILKGERTEPYLVQGGETQMVCSLCFGRAEQAGWIRESASGDVPARGPRPQERRPLLGRLRRKTEPQADAFPPEDELFEDPAGEGEPAPEPEPAREQAPARAARRQDPRHVRAVPTTAEVKIERALDLFNSSEHQRTVSGLARSLGAPYAAAQPDLDQPSAVNLIVAWELSWYRFRIDLGDAGDPVDLAAKGDELSDIDEDLRNWNAGLDAEGRLVIGVAQQ